MLEQIYTYILKHQPVCDKCIAKGFGYNYPQFANGYCLILLHQNLITRIRGKCPTCNRNVTLNRTFSSN